MFLAALVFLLVSTVGVCAQSGSLVIDKFSAEANGAIPDGWQQAWFNFSPKKTVYTVVKEDGNSFLRGESKASASAIYKEVSIDAGQYPILTWKWKVSNTLSKGEEMTEEGDDYSARLYVSFEFRRDNASAFEMLKRSAIRTVYGKDLPGETLVYVWANKLPKGEAVPNPDTAKAVMIAVESGQEKAGKWMLEGRNVYEDYKKFFGSEPPIITHIAVMTDTDNTGEEALASYDDIVFHRSTAVVK